MPPKKSSKAAAKPATAKPASKIAKGKTASPAKASPKKAASPVRSLFPQQLSPPSPTKAVSPKQVATPKAASPKKPASPKAGVAKKRTAGDEAIPKAPLSKVLEEIAHSYSPELSVDPSAVDAIHQAAESYITTVIGEALKKAKAAGRNAVSHEDIVAATEEAEAERKKQLADEAKNILKGKDDASKEEADEAPKKKKPAANKAVKKSK